MMKTLHAEILINAPVKKVWESTIGDEGYREWTSAFTEGSYFEGGWNTGDKLLLLMKDKEGKKQGMTSEIAENRLHEFISIRHLGDVVDGKEEPREWAPAYENYTFKEENGQTKFSIDMEVEEKYEEMFSKILPAALKKLKEFSEK